MISEANYKKAPAVKPGLDYTHCRFGKELIQILNGHA
jgi:hypothetical protein